MKKFIGPMLAVASLVQSASAQPVSSFDDLNYWGTGANRSAVIIQWNDSQSPQALVWGYRWDGAGTLYDLLVDLAASDPALFLRVDTVTAFGPALFGIGYQSGSSPFGLTGTQDENGDPNVAQFVNGIWDNNGSAGVEAPASSTAAATTHAGDRYQEGWFDRGFWGLYFYGSDAFANAPNPVYPTSWTAAWVGASDAALVNDAWYGLSFAPDYDSVEPGLAIAAIPEPSMLSLLLLGSVLLLRRRWK